MGTATSGAGPAVTPSSMGSGTAQEAGTGSAGISTGHGGYLLQAMPAGTVSIARGAQGHLLAHVNMFGLTPGSAHTMVIEAAGQVYPFPGLTADAAGDADVTLASAGRIGQLRAGSRAVIDLGNAESGSLAAEPIAETGALHLGPAVAFRAVTADPAGASQDGASQDGASLADAQGPGGPHLQRRRPDPHRDRHRVRPDPRPARRPHPSGQLPAAGRGQIHDGRL